MPDKAGRALRCGLQQQAGWNTAVTTPRSQNFKNSVATREASIEGTMTPRALLVGLALFAALCHAAVHQDDAGRRVDIARPPQRIVSLAPSLTELVYAVGAGDALVGVDTSSDFPPQARALARVGDFQRFDVERIVALRPDLVLAWRHGNPSREIAQLESLGLHVFELEPRRLADVPRALQRIGALTGRAAAGGAAAARLRASLDVLRTAYAGAELVKVFYQVWREPLLTLNADHLVSDVIALCGGRNAFAGLPQLVPALSLEAAVAANPEVVFTTRPQQRDGEGALRDPGNSEFAPWSRFGSVTAVRDGWLFTLPGDTISRQGPRIDQGARAVCDALQQVREQRPRAARPALGAAR
jgi:iron complex transport system substrate-binding protein